MAGVLGYIISIPILLFHKPNLLEIKHKVIHGLVASYHKCTTKVAVKYPDIFLVKINPILHNSPLVVVQRYVSLDGACTLLPTTTAISIREQSTHWPELRVLHIIKSIPAMLTEAFDI